MFLNIYFAKGKFYCGETVAKFNSGEAALKSKLFF